MEDAPRPKPVMTSAASTPRTTKIRPRPRSPRPATQRPMTAPLRKATFSALFMPPSMAALAVRTLPLVATCIPKNPASTENKAPKTYSPAVTQFTAKPISRNRMTMTTTMVLYSLFRNAMAPSWMYPAISFILSVPSLTLPIQDARP